MFGPSGLIVVVVVVVVVLLLLGQTHFYARGSSYCFFLMRF